MNEQLINAVLEIPVPPDRVESLPNTRSEPPELRAKIEAPPLLTHTGIGEFLERPAIQLLPECETGNECTLDLDSPDTKGIVEDCDESAVLELLSPTQKKGFLGSLGHYEVLKVLGKGGFGVVLKAFDEILQRYVAIKVMNTQLAATAPSRGIFLREARAAAAIRHENIVQVYSVEEQPLPYIVMEYISGETLKERLDTKGPLAAAEVLHIGRQIAAGLAAAHANGLIHLDIKPGNILIEDNVEQKVKITDFGLARAADEGSDIRSEVVSGTPMYMSPEQARGQALDHRTDLFSLGSLLYQLACGRPPFRATTTTAVLDRVSDDIPQPLQEILPEIPDWLVAIISKLHVKRPKDRFQSAKEVAVLLARCESEFQLHGQVTEACGLILSAKQERNALPERQIPSETQFTAMGRNHPVSQRSRIVALSAAGALLLGLLASERMGITHLTSYSHTQETLADSPLNNASLTTSSRESTGRQNQSSMVAAKALPATFKNSIGMEFVIVPKGKSWLGGGNGKLGNQDVEISADFYLGKYEVTQEEWEKVLGVNSGAFKHGEDSKDSDAVKDIPEADLKRFPVETVSWQDCQFFVERLNKLERETDWVYRLPTQAEWEYACRGGPMSDKLDSAFSFYFAKPTNSLLAAQASFKDRGLDRPCKVGSYAPNKLGLFDMHGNVWEWCEDTFETTNRVYRGGAWLNPSEYCRAEAYVANPPSHRDTLLGLRLARVPTKAPSPGAKTPPTAVAPFTDANLQRIAALPAAEQVEEIRKEFRNRNPMFDGTLTPRIENNVITGLKFNTDHVADISPIRALGHLQSLDIRGTYPRNGLLSDLSPLQGMLLHELDCSYTLVTQLTPLRGMPLTILSCHYTQVSELTPLEGMALVTLGIASTRVADLSPLTGMKLQYLMATGIPVKDLTPLQGMSLKSLDLHGTSGVTSLQTLQGMPLEVVNLTDLPVSDLSVLVSKTTLQHVVLNRTQATDVSLAQLKDCKNLKSLSLQKTMVTTAGVDDLKMALPNCNVVWDGRGNDSTVPSSTGDAAAGQVMARTLRPLRTMQKINGEPAEELLRVNKDLPAVGPRENLPTFPSGKALK